MRRPEGRFGADVAIGACSLLRLARQDPEFGHSRRLANPVVAREKTQIMTKNGLTPSDCATIQKGFRTFLVRIAIFGCAFGFSGLFGAEPGRLTVRVAWSAS